MSKLTIHFQRIPDWFGQFVDRCQGRLGYIVGVDVFPRLADVKVLGRTYLPDGESNAIVDRGAAGADEWIDRFAPVYGDNPHVEKWIGPNEYVLWEQDSVDRFNAFHVRFIERMSTLGHGVVCGQINTGWPRLRMFGDPAPYPEALSPTLAALWTHAGVFSLHEYGPGDMRDGAGAHCLRYRNTRSELLQAGIQNLPAFFVTEIGIDVPDPSFPLDHGHRGWREFTDWPGYFDQLQWYSGEMEQDPYVLGASIFTVADDWLTFRLDRDHALDLADFIASDDPEPVPDRAKGLDVCRYQGDVNWELVESDGYTFAMIRVSGPNNDRTDVEVDPRFEDNYVGAGSVGLLRGGYHGLVPDFGGQARLFVGAVGGRPLELGYYGDLENQSLTDAKCAAHLEAVDVQIAAAMGLPVDKRDGVYTNPAFMAGRDGSWGEGRRLWLAHWTDEANIIIPAPWTEWEFWQWTNQGIDVPGVPNRTCLDLYKGTEQELHDKYGDGEEDIVIEIVDRNGNPVEGMTWESVQVSHGLSLTEADPPEGATVFRLARLVYDGSGETNWRLYVLDEDGKPLPGVAGFLGILPDSGEMLPDNAAPRISEDFWGQPEGRPNRALVLQPNELNFTNLDGHIQHSLGGGSNYVLPGPGSHWAWIMPGDEGHYSDVPAGFGMWENHRMFWPVFQRQIEGDDGNGGEVDGDLADVVEQLKRIADAAEYMASHWPFK